MDIVYQEHEILTPIDKVKVYQLIELAGRTAYKSEGKTTNDSAEAFVRKIIKLGHESVLEHVSITVKFVTDRGVTHELVRHRLCSYTQESTRYCNYSKLGIAFIQPVDFDLNDEDKELLKQIEEHYSKKLSQGYTPQQARYFLINGLKTEIVHTANIREWRHILNLRTAKNAHPQMRALMIALLIELRDALPACFNDIEVP